jgi:hypothetical protein
MAEEKKTRLQNALDDWKEFKPWQKWLLLVIAATGCAWIFVTYQRNKQLESYESQQRVEKREIDEAAKLGKDKPPLKIDALPSNNRNQGLEDIYAKFTQLETTVLSKLERIESGKGAVTTDKPAPVASPKMDDPLPPPSSKPEIVLARKAR